MVGKIISYSEDRITGNKTVTFEIDNTLKFESLGALKSNGLVEIKLSKYYPKRNNNANAYCWVLIGKLASEMNISTTEVYKNAIREAGVFDVIGGKANAIENFEKIWSEKGLGWFCDRIDTKDKDNVYVKAYYGSSAYNTKDMHRLLNYLIEDCRALNIETLKEEDINSLVETWRSEENFEVSKHEK